VAREERAEGPPDGRISRFAPDNHVHKQAVAGDHMLLTSAKRRSGGVQKSPSGSQRAQAMSRSKSG
jgi:hypothetical protein